MSIPAEKFSAIFKKKRDQKLINEKQFSLKYLVFNVLI